MVDKKKISFLKNIQIIQQQKKNKKKRIKDINFMFSVYVAISQFAHRPLTIRCHAHGGFLHVATRVYWLEHINMDVKVIVK